MSFQAIWVLASGGGAGVLLVFLFNMKWRFYVQPGGVEESKFCLFSVFYPVRCISSISPRFYFRRHAFCFLPLAAILESLSPAFGLNLQILRHASIYHHVRKFLIINLFLHTSLSLYCFIEIDR
jgi:hypothetical protein